LSISDNIVIVAIQPHFGTDLATQEDRKAFDDAMTAAVTYLEGTPVCCNLKSASEGEFPPAT
jgi:hypothetical protein